MPPFQVRSLDDAGLRRVIAALEAVGDGRSAVVLPEMDASFRADLRAQLVAVAPRLVAEGVRPGTETAPRRESRRAAAADAPPRTAVRTRPMTVLLSGAAVVVLGLGGATWLARGALPGDALYGLKRTAESVDVSLSGSDLDKGHAQLVDAQKRVEEASALLDRPQAYAFGTRAGAVGAISDTTAGLIVSTLAAADSDTRAGVTTIGDDAVTRGDAAGLNLVVAWAQGQRARIDTLVERLPEGSARDRAETSAAEIRAALDRATALQADYTNGTCARDRDRFGVTPCLDEPTPSTTPSSAPAPSGGATTAAPGGGTGGSGGAGGSTAPSTGAPATSSSGGLVPSGLPTSLPTALPTGSATAGAAAPPVNMDTCGVQVSLPVAEVSLGTCAPRR